MMYVCALWYDKANLAVQAPLARLFARTRFREAVQTFTGVSGAARTTSTTSIHHYTYYLKVASLITYESAREY